MREAKAETRKRVNCPVLLKIVLFYSASWALFFILLDRNNSALPAPVTTGVKIQVLDRKSVV